MKAIFFAFISFILISGYSYAQDQSYPTPAGRSPAVDFFQEEITLTVTDSSMLIDGVFHFRNNTSRDIPLPVLFPFHVDSAASYPHRIEAYLLPGDSARQSLRFSEIRKGNSIRIRLPVKAKSEVSWQLVYEQKISTKRAVYIITSTAAWKKPLTEATYLFVAPEDFEIDYIWPEPDSSYTKNGLIYRRCFKKDFMPSREMEIIWK